MDLNTVWFILIAVLFIGFFFLEGFDYGVGMLLPFIAKDDQSRRLVINAIGPFWDGNEVWLLTAGGALFAAFPNWYATLFSGFYLALFLMLAALIFRGVAFEFRSKNTHPKWRSTWDWAIFFGSFLPALLWGVAIANIVKGVPIDRHMNYVGGFFNLLNPYALVGGITAVLVFLLHGALFLSLKISGNLEAKAKAAAQKIWIWAVVFFILFIILNFTSTDIFTRKGLAPAVVPVIALGTLLSVRLFVKNNRTGWAFIMTALTIVFSTVFAFLGLFPRVMTSSLNPDWSLTIYNASSSPYTLKIMTIVAAIFVPFVLVYQAWSYWVFRKRLSGDTKLEY
ncbi:MAG: cytochrome d ubiquinol oxidase subunit II, partial [Calditrichaeota bacterium]|nr:cytochrome d ubiquinol oxidase subunit II [Calditrichota bacterium]